MSVDPQGNIYTKASNVIRFRCTMQSLIETKYVNNSFGYENELRKVDTIVQK